MATRTAGLLGAAAAVMLLTAAPPATAQAAGDTLEVAGVRFDGVRTFDRRLLATAIVTSGPRCNVVAPLCWLGFGVEPQYYDERTVGADVVRLRLFYYQRGYRSAEVEPDTIVADDGRIRVRFRIDEREPVRVGAIEFDAESDVPPEALRGLPLRVGAPFDLLVFDATRDTLEARLNNRGYANAVVLANSRIPRDSPNVALVQYALHAGEPAFFGPIAVTGARRVSPAVVRRMLTFRPGDLYSRDALLRSQRNLFAQELFRHAEIRVEPSAAADSLIDVEVRVNEGDLHRVRGGMGLSSSDYLNLEGRWASRSFFGGARRLELRGRISNLLAEPLGAFPAFETVDDYYGRLMGTVGADFTQPWFFDPLNTFNAGIFFERRSLPDVYVRTATGGYLSFTRLIGLNATATAGYRPELTRLGTRDGDLIFCLGFVACDEETVRALSEPHWLAPFSLTFGWDRSNSLFAPTRGWILRFDGEHASTVTGSDFGYSRVAAEFIDYSTLGRGVVVATRLRPGVAWPSGTDPSLGVHPTRRFFAGGPNSVRGFAQYRLGPKLLTADAAGQLVLPVAEGGAGCSPQSVNGGTCDPTPIVDRDPNAFSVQPVGGAASFEANAELRFPLFRDYVRGVAFVDAGQVWQETGRMTARDLVWTPGVGVRYFSPIGPIRVDIGYNTAGAERTPVVTTTVEYCPAGGLCEPIHPDRDYDPADLRNTAVLRPLQDVTWNPRRSVWNRLQLHFSIGQAF